MVKQSEKPFHKIMIIRARLGMYVEHGDAALQGQTPQEFAAEVNECFGYLMDFRNIINGMVSFDETPDRAIVRYIPSDVLKEAADLDAG